MKFIVGAPNCQSVSDSTTTASEGSEQASSSHANIAAAGADQRVGGAALARGGVSQDGRPRDRASGVTAAVAIELQRARGGQGGRHAARRPRDPRGAGDERRALIDL